MIAAKTTLIDGDLVETNNNGVVDLNDDSLPVTRLVVPKFVAPLPVVTPPPVDPITFFTPDPPPVPADNPAIPEGVAGNGPAIVEAASQSIASPPAKASDGSPTQLPTVTVTGTADSKTSIPWVHILMVLGVAVAIIVAVKVFRKRG